MWVIALVWLIFFGAFLVAVSGFVLAAYLRDPERSRFGPLAVASLLVTTTAVILSCVAIYISL